MALTSRPILDTTQKVNPNQAKRYSPLVLSDETVYDMAAHNYTMEQIAERFGVTRKTVIDLHLAAYNAGKDEATNLPRKALAKVIGDFMSDPSVNLAALPNTSVLLKAIEIHARKYEGYGQTQTVITKTEDRPSVSDIKFTPLQAEE